MNNESTTTLEKNNQATANPSIAGKYLTFLLSKENYGIHILKIVEIFGMMKIKEVPRTAKHMKGVINLRGKIIPVADLRLRFGLEERAYDDKTCIIVVNGTKGESEEQIGLIVDTVLEVQDFKADLIAPPPEYGTKLDSEFIIGIGRTESEAVTVLLDVDKII